MKIYVVLMSDYKYWDSFEVAKRAGASVDAAKKIAQDITEGPINWEEEPVVYPSDDLQAYGVSQGNTHYAIVETELAE